jgi:hypothetical protein
LTLGQIWVASPNLVKFVSPETIDGRLGVVGVDLSAAPAGAGAGSRTAGRRVSDRAEVCGVVWHLVDRTSYGRNAVEPSSKL